MDIPNMFQPALNKISSMASTAKSGITSALNFTGSFTDRTRLLLDPELGPAQAAAAEEEEEEPAPPAQAQEAAPASITAAVHSLDVEAATPLPPSAAGEGHTQDAAEAKRVGKSVQTVCLFAASASLVLFVNLPSSSRDGGVSSKLPTGAAALYGADLAFISLGFFSSLGLSMFSIMARPGEAAVATVQKWGMVVAVASVLVAFTLRMCMMPVA